MLEKGYTDEMILGFKSVTKQLLRQGKNNVVVMFILIEETR